MEQWITEYCPKCDNKNWVNNGDPNDLTVEDVMGIKCWHCGACWAIDEDCDDEDLDYELGKNLGQ